MSMCDHEPFYLLDVALQIADIRYYKVNSQHVVFRE